jgi:outer membrane receptor protein involved in Fe transport
MFKKLLFTIFIALISGTVYAQSGKITGKVVDAETGEPLTGATVGIQGTTRGALVDFDGNYLILNVPPGSYVLEARFLGYSTVVVQDVVVRTDLTTEQDFKMQLEAFEGEEIVVVAEKEVILKDVTSSESRVSSEEIEKLPVQEVTDIVQLQAGVNVGNNGALHIRGGRASEVSYVVDGIRVTDDFDRSQGLRIENQAVQELQVVSGSFNAEHGQALSGVVNVVTKSGTNKYDATFRSWGGAYLVSRGGLYDGLANNVMEFNPLDQTNYAISVSGPIIKDKLTFFATARAFQNEGWLNGRNAFSPQGPQEYLVPLGTNFDTYRTPFGQRVDESLPWFSVTPVTIGGVDQLRINDTGRRDSSLVNINTFDIMSFQTNLEYRMSQTLKFNLIANYAEEEGRGYNHSNRLNPGGIGNFYRDNYALNFKATLTPSSKTFITLNAATRYNRFENYLYEDPFDFRYFNFEESSLVNQPQNFNFFGTDNGRGFRSTETFIIKGEISSQVTNRHFIKAGINFQQDIVKVDGYSLRPIDGEGVFVPDELSQFLPDNAGVGDPVVSLGIPPVNTPFRNKLENSPYQISAYVQDKIEYENFIVNMGLRLDYFDPNARIPADPNDPDIFNPTKPQNQYIDQNGDGVRQPSEPLLTVEDRESYWWDEASPKFQLSPRFGIAYSINDRGVVYFSYGTFFQIPSYSFLFSNRILLQDVSGTQGIFGNPDLDPERSIQYEIGLKQEIFDGTAIEVTGFYKNIRDYVTSGAPIRTGSTQIIYDQFFNRDFATSRGLTLALNQAVGNRVSLNVDYTFSIAEGNNSDPAEEFFRQQGLDADTTGENAVTSFVQPLNWDRSHIINGSLFYSGNTWGANLVSRILTGTPYTPAANIPGVTLGPVASQRDLRNTQRLPTRFTLDLNAYKNFNLGGNTRMQLFVNVFNLLDNQLINGVFNDSGEPDLPLPVNINPNADLRFFQDPSRFAEPRRIQIGIEIAFN